jgi:hypothetical protein
MYQTGNDKMPDLVIPPAEMGTFFDPHHQVCGFTFSDATGQKFLLPIPGAMMSALINDARRQLDSFEGSLNWISQPGVAVEQAPSGN